MKLVRNLGCYNYNDDYYNLRKYRCPILYYWIYKSVEERKINTELITEIFNDSYSRRCTYNRKAYCYYYHYYYDKFEEPMNMIFLEIFQNNINTVLNMLNNQEDIMNDKLQRYICKCINIYYKMNETYCVKNPNNNNNNNQMSNLTCSILRSFKQTYDSYLLGEIYHEKYAIPFLEDAGKVYSDQCLLPDKEIELIKINRERIKAFLSSKKYPSKKTYTFLQPEYDIIKNTASDSPS
ncbi:hypothetical protein PCYB_006330, partial [Plasmodium cynomolgi strain B]